MADWTGLAESCWLINCSVFPGLSIYLEMNGFSKYSYVFQNHEKKCEIFGRAFHVRSDYSRYSEAVELKAAYAFWAERQAAASLKIMCRHQYQQQQVHYKGLEVLRYHIQNDNEGKRKQKALGFPCHKRKAKDQELWEKYHVVHYIIPETVDFAAAYQTKRYRKYVTRWEILQKKHL